MRFVGVVLFGPDVYVETRQRGTQPLDARRRDTGLPDVEPLQFPQRREMLEAGIGDPGAVQVQVLELLQCAQLGESGVAQPRPTQMQSSQVCQRGDRCGPLV